MRVQNVDEHFLPRGTDFMRFRKPMNLDRTSNLQKEALRPSLRCRKRPMTGTWPVS
jgi:hypothetical protein